MNQLVIDPLTYMGYSMGWPVYLYRRLSEAGFRLKPVPKIAPTAEDLQAAIEPPWSAYFRRIDMALVVEQGDSPLQASQT